MLLDEALSSDRVVLSVMGSHAGEAADAIFARKLADIDACGVTYWLCCSPAARPDRTQLFDPHFVIFLAASSSSGARPTTTSERVSEVSTDRVVWKPIEPAVGPVTGRLVNGAYAFALPTLETASGSVDLWSYSTPGESPIRFKLGASTTPARKGYAEGMLSRHRCVLAVARLAGPKAVWVR